MMRYFRLLTFCFICTCVFSEEADAISPSCGETTIDSEESLEVSMENLIADPEKYQCKKVTVTGYYRQSYEEHALYLHENSTYREGIWVSYFEGDIFCDRDLDEYDIKKKEWQKYDNKYIEIVSIFDMNGRGHGGLYNGCLCEIFKVRVLGEDGPN